MNAGEGSHAHVYELTFSFNPEIVALICMFPPCRKGCPAQRDITAQHVLHFQWDLLGVKEIVALSMCHTRK